MELFSFDISFFPLSSQATTWQISIWRIFFLTSTKKKFWLMKRNANVSSWHSANVRAATWDSEAFHYQNVSSVFNYDVTSTKVSTCKIIETVFSQCLRSLRTARCFFTKVRKSDLLILFFFAISLWLSGIARYFFFFFTVTIILFVLLK